MNTDVMEKPWAKLRMSRQQYSASRIWKKCGMERDVFEKKLQLIPDELIGRMYEEANAERLIEAMFGKGCLEDE